MPVVLLFTKMNCKAKLRFLKKLFVFDGVKNNFPFYTQQDRRHEATTNRKSVENLYIVYISGSPTLIL